MTERVYREARTIAAGRGRTLRPRKEHLQVLIRLLDAACAERCPNPHCDGRGRLRETPNVGCAVCLSRASA